MEPITLTSADGQLTLSCPTLADTSAITDLCHDPEIARWTTVPNPYTADNARSYVIDVAEPGWLKGDASWKIETNDGKLVGTISLSRMAPGGFGEIGYWIGKEFRGTGYATLAARTVIDYAFDVVGMEIITWHCFVDGDDLPWGSVKVAWRNGFTFEGRMRGHVFGANRRPMVVRASLAADEPREPRTAWRGPDGVLPAFDDPHKPEALVRQFHSTYNLPIVDSPDVDRDRVHMRMGLIAEEFGELVGSVYGKAARDEVESAYERALGLDDGERDTVETADALGDLVYVIYGMALEMGIPMSDVLAEIQRSNLSKLGADGKPIYREDGKVLKGPDYFRPNIARVLGLEEK